MQTLKSVRFKEFNKTSELFLLSEGTVELYSHYTDLIGSYFYFPQSFTGLVANLILYYTTDSMLTELNDPGKVLSCFQEAQELAQMGRNYFGSSNTDPKEFSVHQFLHALNQMKNLFGTFKIQSESIDSSVVPRPLEMTLTETEECWIKERFSRIQEQFVSVTPCEDYMRELVDLLANGKPVSSRFSPQVWLIITERVRRVLKIHPEFTNLPDYEQQILWRKKSKICSHSCCHKDKFSSNRFNCHKHIHNSQFRFSLLCLLMINDFDQG